MEFRLDAFPLTVLFVILKLFGAIDWSWWWVFSPLWILYSLWIVLAILAGLIHSVEKEKNEYR